MSYETSVANKKVGIHHKMFQSVDEKDAILVQDADKKYSCSRCGMNLVKFYKTSHTAKLNSKNYQYCSLHCFVEHLNENGKLKNPKVVDVSSLKLIPIFDAYYVVGSKVRGTMSRVSKYAFASIDDAKAFQEKNGGKIVRFKEALEIAKKDF
jgi:nitrous oxide reductase accessory protein NosL